MTVPYPDDDYLIKLGKLAYSVGYLEWAILGNLPGLKNLPASIDVTNLVGQTTHGIGEIVAGSQTLAQVSDAGVKAWLREGGKALKEAAPDRNRVLHARPATDPEGRQRLYRWDPKRGDIGFVTDDELDELLSRMDDRLRRVDEKRPPRKT